MKLLSKIVATLIILSATWFIPENTAIAQVSNITLTPSLPSGQVSGTTIKWDATASGIGTLVYRFSVGLSGGDPRVVRDYSTASSFEWTPIEEATYNIKVSVRQMSGAGNVTELSLEYIISSRVTDSPMATLTAHPLVALYSAPACPLDSSMRVEFRPSDSGDNWQTTNLKPCSTGRSMNFYVAGMTANTAYEMQHLILSAAGEARGALLTVTTGEPGITFPSFTVRDAVDTGITSTSDDLIFMSSFPADSKPLPLAVDLAGNPVWYYSNYNDAVAISTGVTPEATVLLLVSDGTVQGQFLREVDLAGNIVRETNVGRINDQLTAMGQDSIGAFDHEAIRFPNGYTLFQGSVERLMPGIQGAVADILGEMIVALDDNWQVVWAWNAFAHLDVKRKATGNEVCVDTDSFSFPGCPPLFKAGSANDWLHGNAIAFSPSDGNLIYSMRHQDWVIKIDYRNGAGTGNVLWRHGEGGDFSITSSDPSPWHSHQHGPVYISNTQVSIFDNGNIRCNNGLTQGCYSRGQIYSMDETNKTSTLSLNASMENFSIALGSSQRLSNGSYSFTSGAQSEGAALFVQAVEITQEGLSSYVLESNATIYRAYRMRSLYESSLMAIPAASSSYTYPSVFESGTPMLDSDPAGARPLSLGAYTDSGVINISAGLLPFAGSADIYIAISLDGAIYVVHPDLRIQPLSSGLVAWKTNTSGPVDETLYSNIPLSSLQAGTYLFYLAATPYGDTGRYYLWQTSLVKD